MKKNVFEGFEGLETQQLEAVSGGYFYQVTSCGNTQCDEEYVTEKGETDPWSGDNIGYQAVDQRWDGCSGITTNPSGSGSGTATGTR